MSGEAKDPAIKLFGKTIPLLPDIPRSVNNTELVLPLTPSCSLPENNDKQRKEEDNGEEEEEEEEDNQEEEEEEEEDNQEEEDEDEEDDKELQDRNRGSSDGSDTPPDNDSDRGNKSKSNNSHDKTLKKPDKILPCPRCNSMDTKFCYYNNYNVNQPRHFCKNCQRYWTAGGTMRNVPVGAGRRKNKTAASNHYHQVTAPEILPSPPEAKPEPNSGFPNEIPGPHWPYPWPPVPPPVIYPPVVPPFYPAPAYWVPLLPQPCFPNSSSGMNSPTLGKRSRDEAVAATTMVRPSDSEPIKNSVLVPKTLRIYDPREAAKSSIWAALSESPGGGIFKGFQPNGHGKNNIGERDSVLQDNPAALSRSLNFHEAI